MDICEYRRGRREAMLDCMKLNCHGCQESLPIEWVDQIQAWRHRLSTKKHPTGPCFANEIRKKFEREGFKGATP